MLILFARDTRPDAIPGMESPPLVALVAPEADCTDGDLGLGIMLVLFPPAIALAGRTCLTAEVVALLY